MQTREAQKMPDWGVVPLDDTGKGIQEQMTKRFQVCRFPLLELFLLTPIIATTLAGNEDIVRCINREA